MENIIHTMLAAAIKSGYSNEQAIARLQKHCDTLTRQAAKRKTPSKACIENQKLGETLLASMVPGVPYKVGELTVIEGTTYSTQKTSAILRTLASAGHVTAEYSKDGVRYKLV